jgi:glucose-6-phosphate 1-dehydrogenase
MGISVSGRERAPAAAPGLHRTAVQTLLILGAGGDLTARLLLPGLGALLAAGSGHDLLLVGSDRDEWDDGRWRTVVADAFATSGAPGPEVDAVVNAARYIKGDASDEADLRRVLDACPEPLAIYFALPPAVTEKSCRALVQLGLSETTRLVLEKPFGTDAESAEALNELVAQLVPEEHVHRVDHFLGMATVLNILGLRFANRILEPVLNAEHVQCVEVVFDESLGLEGRAGFYDDAGALVDMVQSHLLQVLAFVAMEAPSSLAAQDVRDCKAHVLRATHVWDDDPAAFSRRARYTAGEVDGRSFPSYVDEEGVDPSRETETLAEVVFAVDTWRWAGVPFRVRSGKALASPRQEVAITFKPPQRVPVGLKGYEWADRLRIGLGAGRLQLDLNVNGPGDPFRIEPVTLEAGFGPGELLEYGEVLKGVLEGDPPLSVRGDTSVRSWHIVEPVLKAWRRGAVPLEEYPAGSAGPNTWPRSEPWRRD